MLLLPHVHLLVTLFLLFVTLLLFTLFYPLFTLLLLLVTLLHFLGHDFLGRWVFLCPLLKHHYVVYLVLFATPLFFGISLRRLLLTIFPHLFLSSVLLWLRLLLLLIPTVEKLILDLINDFFNLRLDFGGFRDQDNSLLKQGFVTGEVPVLNKVFGNIRNRVTDYSAANVMPWQSRMLRPDYVCFLVFFYVLKVLDARVVELNSRVDILLVVD